MSKKKRALFWFRRDLRIEDNAAFYHALKECDLVAPIYIFDRKELSILSKEDRKIVFIWNSLCELRKELQGLNSDIIIRYGDSLSEIVGFAKKFNVDCVYANEDYDPESIKRDAIIKENLNLYNIEYKLYKDHVIYAKDEILNQKGEPYKTFSSYRSAWLKKVNEEDVSSYTEINFYHKLCNFNADDSVTLKSMGFVHNEKNKFVYGSKGAKALFDKFNLRVLRHYSSIRNTPYISGVSYLSPHIRYGTISVRQIVSHIFKNINTSDVKKKQSIQAWLDAFIIRDFYFQLLYHNPYIVRAPFKLKYKDFQWENDWFLFQKWCEGKTGFPIIDAAMKQLNSTGYMHNRLRLIVAAFLTKDLLIDYRFGESYFAYQLLDFEISSNNANWQWIASMGGDNQQGIKFFNPVKQSEKFDSEARFIKKYLPIFKNVPSKFLHEPWKYKKEILEYGIEIGKDYPYPIINHEERRKIAFSKYENIESLN